MDSHERKENDSALLEIRGLSKEFAVGGLWRKVMRVLDDVDMEVLPGEIRGIVGESGSGKTTLARCSLRLIEPTAGIVRFDGQDLCSMTPAALRAKRKEFQMIFQDVFGSLSPHMTVRQILAEPLEVHGIGTRDTRNRQINELLESVALSPLLLSKKPSELSGGQQQRVVIARSLVLRPKLLIADEPTSALDASVAAQMLNLLGELQRRYNLTLVLISHSLPAIHYLCTHVSVLYSGRIVEDSPAESFFNEPKHPYSFRLVQSMLKIESGRASMHSPKSMAKDPSPSRVRVEGCVFYEMCPHRMSVCRVEVPILKEIRPKQKVACFLYSNS